MGRFGTVQRSPFRKDRRRSQRPPRIAEVERLEARLVLASGTGSGIAAVVPAAESAQPSRFESAAQWKQFLIDAAVAQWRSLLGQQFPRNPEEIPSGDDTISGPETVRPVALAAATSARPSETNNQVQGVDEGDIVETDGRFLYILSGRTLTIVDARHPDALAIASSTAIEGVPVAAHLSGTRLTILSQVGGFSGGPVLAGDVARVAIELLPIPYSPPKLKVTEFDVSNAAVPRGLRATTLDGSYVASRAVGDRITVVVSHDLDALPGPEVHTTDDEYVYETEAAYRARLETLDVTPTLPQFTSEVSGPDGPAQASGPLLRFDAIYRPTSPEDQSLLSVLTFDARQSTPGPAGAIGIVAPSASAVYATADHLYLVGTRWSAPDSGAPSESTVIQKFILNSADATLTAVGTVPGRVLNQFALDEHGSYLRIATTTASWDGTTLHTDNALYVLAQRDGTLAPVGSLTGLAPGEQIYAARFFGDRAFLVTFRQVDPLFALDLSDPTAPRSVGELKVPGFSRYLHPVDATHILGIGRDADPQTGQMRGLQVSLFDVSDLAHPRQVDSETIAAAGWVWSEAEFEHHAVSYFSETHTLAIPVNIQGDSWDGTGEAPAPRSELWVFQVDPDQGIALLGQVQHQTPVLRSVNFGDVLFSISSDAVKASPLLDPSTTLGQVALGHAEDGAGSGPGGPIDVVPFPIETVAASDPGVIDPSTRGATGTGNPLPPDPPAGRSDRPSPGVSVASRPMPLGEAFRRGGRRHLHGRRHPSPVAPIRRQAVPKPTQIARPVGINRLNAAVRRAIQARPVNPGHPLTPVASRRLEALFRRLLARRLG